MITGAKSHQHYVLTGNEGVGINDAVQEIYQRLVDVSGLMNCISTDAVSMFDPNMGKRSRVLEMVDREAVDLSQRAMCPISNGERKK